MADEPKLTGALRVGAVRFNKGVKLATVQAAIDRAVPPPRKANAEDREYFDLVRREFAGEFDEDSGL